jgi:hypothetical protein
MSSSGSKPGFKEMAIEHGEKFILGLAGVFVLIGIGTTQWSTYEKKPEEFAAKIEAGKAEFGRSTWPETEKETFVAIDPGEEVAKLLEGIPHGQKYEYLVKWVHRITKAREKVAEPEYMAIENLVADAGPLLLELTPEEEQPVGGTSPDIRVASADEVAGNKIDKPKIQGPRPDGPRPEGPRPGGSAGYPGGASPEEDVNAGEDPGYGGGLMEDYAGAGEYGGATRNVEARGTRFAAIRGIFKMKQQIEKVKRALRLDTAQEAYTQVRFWDFELQRQTAVAGADPWGNDWEDVDIEVAVKLLERIEFDVDVVDEQYRDAVFTMPLPYRVTGSWSTAAGPNGILASHPQIKRLLSEKEQLEQETRSKALLKAAEQEKKIKESGGRGFQRVQLNTRSMRSSMMGNADAMSAYTSSYNDLQMEADPEYNSENSGYPGSYPGGAMGRMDVFATPELMLFRFLDFSVVPGNAYRYRVRLKLLNPNFDRDPGELQDFASREGKYRFTPWSEISTPALIQDENEVYVAKVDQRRGVSVDAYQWMSETGTYVHGPFEGLDRGDRIASWTREVKSRRRGAESETQGGVTTEVLRPSAGTFMEEQIDFVTPNTLVDYNRETLLDPNDHPDLELATKRLPNTFQEIVVVNRFGDLIRLDTVGNAAAHESAKRRMTQQDELWSHLKRAAPAAGGGIDELMMEGYPGMEEGYPGMGGGKPSNPKRRSSTKRNAQSMMYGGSGEGEGAGYP